MSARCEVPDCEAEPEFDAPCKWCEKHWWMWWEWPESEPQPDWMPDDADE